MIDRDIIDRLFLELSQFTTATTARELALEKGLKFVLECKTLMAAQDAAKTALDTHKRKGDEQ